MWKIPYLHLSKRSRKTESRTSRGRRAVEKAVRPLFEAEELEARTLLSFVAHISAAPTGALSPSGFTVNVWVDGANAKKFVVDWGDGNSTTDPRTSFTAGTEYQESHPYSQVPTSPVKFTATLAVSPFSTSTAYFSLSQSFGDWDKSGTTNFPVGAQSGMSAHTASSGSNSAGKAMVLGTDSSSDPALYVASLDTGNRMAVTRYYAPGSTAGTPGTVDSSWGMNGTVEIPQFGSGTETDIPYGIAWDNADTSRFVLVFGKATYGGTTGWAVAEVDPNATVNWKQDFSGGLPSGSGSVAMSGLFVDQSTQGTLGQSVILTGTDGTHMVAAVVYETGTNKGTLNTSFGSSGIETVSLPTGVSTMAANSIIQMQDTTTNGLGQYLYKDDFLLGGNATYPACYTNSCGCVVNYTASDFTVVRLHQSGSVDTSFGSSGIARFNIAHSVSNCTIYSYDSVYSLLEWNDTTNSKWDVFAVGTTNNNQGGGDHFAIARWNEETGAIDTGFGQNSTGGTIGPAGDAYSASLEGSGQTSVLSDTSVTIVAGGTASIWDPSISQYINEFQAARFTKSGSLDSTFGNAGVQDVGFGDSQDIAYSVVVVPSSSDDSATDILLGGSTYGSGTSLEMGLADLLPSNDPSS